MERIISPDLIFCTNVLKLLVQTSRMTEFDFLFFLLTERAPAQAHLFFVITITHHLNLLLQKCDHMTSTVTTS